MEINNGNDLINACQTRLDFWRWIRWPLLVYVTIMSIGIGFGMVFGLINGASGDGILAWVFLSVIGIRYLTNNWRGNKVYIYILNHEAEMKRGAALAEEVSEPPAQGKLNAIKACAAIIIAGVPAYLLFIGRNEKPAFGVFTIYHLISVVFVITAGLLAWGFFKNMSRKNPPSK